VTKWEALEPLEMSRQIKEQRQLLLSQMLRILIFALRFVAMGRTLDLMNVMTVIFEIWMDVVIIASLNQGMNVTMEIQKMQILAMKFVGTDLTIQNGLVTTETLSIGTDALGFAKLRTDGHAQEEHLF